MSHPAPSPPSTRNIAWIVIASLLVAILLAIVLVMVVVAGLDLPRGRKLADVRSDHRRHRFLAREPLPDFSWPHAEFLGESRVPPSDSA